MMAEEAPRGILVFDDTMSQATTWEIFYTNPLIIG